jgi:hypothetical protein
MLSSPHLRAVLFCLVALSTGAPIERGHAGEADVVDVAVRHAGDGRFDFDVTVRSNDRGWSHYADKIEVLAPDGSVLGTRVLLHPHETEQPFTRDVYGVAVPPGIAEVVVRVHHKPTGYDGAVMTVRLPR